MRSAQSAFNPFTLNDCKEAGWAVTFFPEDRDQNWFHDDFTREAMRYYFMLDIQI